jgi:ABC-type phosphate transport system substrate-binding protein
VGNGVDYSAEVSSGNLSSVVGSFSSITPGATEAGQQNGTGPQVANTFSLQLNAKPFTSPTCSGSSAPASCQGWQQFIYSTTTNTVFMQYWLLYYNAACPAGWTTYSVGGATFCYKDSPHVALTGGAVTAANLPSTSLTGTAGSGGNDSATLVTGAGSATSVGAATVLGLSGAWTGVEWGVYGDCCGTSANFSAGTTLKVQTVTHNGTTMAPACVFEGFTGETNNLNLAATPALTMGASPTMVSNQTTAAGTPSCASAGGEGDTHLDTFSDLLYDFQASGDFQSITTSSGFIAQNRQVSGAPTWPNAAVNQAVAARIGSANVAVCTGPTRLEVNGTATALSSGGQIALAGGGTISLSGTTYLLRDTSGDSVTATVNSNGSLNWIDERVGLGRWPQPIGGILASSSSNPDALVASNGTVLTAPFDFSSLYNAYTNGWRVSGIPDMLTACSGTPSSSIPQDEFTANQLAPAVATQAQQACAAAGVTVPALLNACMIDEAVEGQSAPAVYKSLPAEGLLSGAIDACGDGPATPGALTDIAGVGAPGTEGLMDAVAEAYNGTNPSARAADWDGVNPADCTLTGTIVTKGSSPTDETCQITRPTSSGAGLTALTSAPSDGGHPCIDYARSSAASPAGSPAGLAWVPVGRDAVSWTTPNSNTAKPATLTPAQLQAIYTCAATNWNQVGGSSAPIVPVLPQAGSGTRSSFLAMLGITTPGPCVVNGSVNVPNATSNPLPIEENTGVSPTGSGGSYLTGNAYEFASNPNAIFPYSVADWIAQEPAPAGGGHGYAGFAPGVLNGPQEITSVSPAQVHSGAIDTINPSFSPSFTQTVWNVVRNAGTTTAPAIPPNLVPLFGPTAQAPHGLCSDTALIQSYGFATIGSACGSPSVSS